MEDLQAVGKRRGVVKTTRSVLKFILEQKRHKEPVVALPAVKVILCKKSSDCKVCFACRLLCIYGIPYAIYRDRRTGGRPGLKSSFINAPCVRRTALMHESVAPSSSAPKQVVGTICVKRRRIAISLRRAYYCKSIGKPSAVKCGVGVPVSFRQILRRSWLATDITDLPAVRIACNKIGVIDIRIVVG